MRNIVKTRLPNTTSNEELYLDVDEIVEDCRNDQAAKVELGWLRRPTDDIDDEISGPPLGL